MRTSTLAITTEVVTIALETLTYLYAVFKELAARSKRSQSFGSGGAERDRTVDLRLAKPALSQLSYSPGSELVGLARFELAASRLSGVRSNQLSYRPKMALAFPSLHLHFSKNLAAP